MCEHYNKYEELKNYIMQEHDSAQKHLTLHEHEMSAVAVNEYKARIHQLDRIMEMTKHIDILK